MTKKIKSSLFAKVFLITVIMLFCMSLLVFGMLAWLMPQTYSNKLNTILDERAQGFVSELEQVPFSDSGGLFDQFIADMEINSVELYNSGGDWVALPTKEFDNEWGGISHKRNSMALVKPPPFYQTITIFLSLTVVTAIRSLSMVRQNISWNCNSPLSAFSR